MTDKYIIVFDDPYYADIRGVLADQDGLTSKKLAVFFSKEEAKQRIKEGKGRGVHRRCKIIKVGVSRYLDIGEEDR